MIGLLALLVILSPLTALACTTSSGCAAGQYCAVDSRLPGGSQCYAVCHSSSGGSGGCSGTDRCVSVTGTEVCLPDSSPLVTGSGTTLPACGTAGRTCPSDHTYQCVENQCHLANGQPCESDAECLSGSACTPAPTGSSHVCTTSSAPVGSETPETPFVPITPQLGAPIPGVSLSPSTREGDIVSVPFLAQYINGAYRYLIGVSLIAAIVMVVYGGFRYLVGSSLGDIKAGKKIITDALGGMLIVLAAYMILNTINPATLNLSILRLQFVNRIDIDSTLDATQVDTVGVSEDIEGNPVAGSATAVYTDCPVTLTTPPSDPPTGTSARGTEFLGAMTTLLGTGGTSRDRVLRLAEGAAKCGVALGSCGHTAETIYTTAGSPARGHQTHTIPQEIIVEMGRHKCEHYSRDCNQPAIAAMFQYTRDRVPSWPTGWTNELQAGDVITIFNANSDGFGLHRAVFMGWASAGRAQVVQGAYGRLVRDGTICLTTDCPNPQPLVRTFQPR